MSVVDDLNYLDYLLMENMKDYHHFLKDRFVFFFLEIKFNFKENFNILDAIVCKTE